MLTSIQSVGVAPEVNLRNSAGKKACKWEVYPGFETQDRRHQKSKPGYQWPHEKHVCSSKNNKKKNTWGTIVYLFDMRKIVRLTVHHLTTAWYRLFRTWHLICWEFKQNYVLLSVPFVYWQCCLRLIIWTCATLFGTKYRQILVTGGGPDLHLLPTDVEGPVTISGAQ